MIEFAPGFTSRTVYIDTSDFPDGVPAQGHVSFSIPCDIYDSGKKILAQKRTERVEFDANGHLEISLPAYTTSTFPEEWAIEVRTSWGNHPYWIRVPAGASRIHLNDIMEVRAVPRNQAITGATASAVAGGTTNASVSLRGGVLHFGFTLPNVTGQGYDTGWRDFTSLLANGWGGRAMGRRIGQDVDLEFRLDGTGATASTVLSLPTWAAPSFPSSSGIIKRFALDTAAGGDDPATGEVVWMGISGTALLAEEFPRTNAITGGTRYFTTQSVDMSPAQPAL